MGTLSENSVLFETETEHVLLNDNFSDTDYKIEFAHSKSVSSPILFFFENVIVD